MATVRSHYLPRTYLKHFLQDDELVMYKKGVKFFKDKTTSPLERIVRVRGESGLNTVGLKNHLYDPEMDGITSDDLEEIFREFGENTYDETITNIGQLNLNDEIPQLVKDRLCMMMAAMRVRTPLFKHEIEEMDEGMRKRLMSEQMKRTSVEKLVKQFKDHSGLDVSVDDAAAVKEMITNSGFSIKYPNSLFIKQAMRQILHLADVYHQMTMTICKSENRFFITTDNPVVNFVPPEHVNFYEPPRALVTPHAEVFFPLSKTYALHMTWRKKEQKLISISRKVIDIFNYNLAHNSFEFIFAPIELKELKKFTEEHIPYPYKFTIS